MNETSKSSARTAVFVLGMHRSGTSVLAGALGKLGCDLPATLMAGNKDNEKGFFESDPIYRLNQKILQSVGSDWYDWRTLPNKWEESSHASKFRDEAITVLEQEFLGSPFFVIKDPRISRLVPFWIAVCKDMNITPKFVNIIRNPLEVSESLYRRDGFHRETSQLIWLHYNLQSEHDTRGYSRTYITYDSILTDWIFVFDTIQKDIDVALPRFSQSSIAEVDDFITNDLRHNSIGETRILRNPLASKWISTSYATLLRWAQDGESKKDYGVFEEFHREMLEAKPVFDPIIRRAQEIEKKFQDTSSRNMKIEADLKAANFQIDETAHALRERDELIKDLSLKSDEHESAIELLKGQISQNLSEIAQKRHELDQYDHQKTQLQSTLNELIKANDDLSNENSLLQSSLDELRNSNNSLSNDKVQLQSALDKLTLENEALFQEKAQLLDSMNALDHKLEDAMCKKEELRDIILQMRSEKEAALNEHRIKRSRSEDELASFVSLFSELETKFETERKLLNEKSKQMGVLLRDKSADLERHQSKIKELTQQQKAKSHEHAKKVEQLTAEIQMAHGAIKELRESTSWRITAPMRKIVLMVRRSIPWIRG